jgi:hypothetical protein
MRNGGKLEQNEQSLTDELATRLWLSPNNAMNFDNWCPKVLRLMPSPSEQRILSRAAL